MKWSPPITPCPDVSQLTGPHHRERVLGSFRGRISVRASAEKRSVAGRFIFGGDSRVESRYDGFDKITINPDSGQSGGVSVALNSGVYLRGMDEAGVEEIEELKMGDGVG